MCLRDVVYSVRSAPTPAGDDWARWMPTPPPRPPRATRPPLRPAHHRTPPSRPLPPPGPPPASCMAPSHVPRPHHVPPPSGAPAAAKSGPVPPPGPPRHAGGSKAMASTDSPAAPAAPTDGVCPLGSQLRAFLRMWRARRRSAAGAGHGRPGVRPAVPGIGIPVEVEPVGPLASRKSAEVAADVP